MGRLLVFLEKCEHLKDSDGIGKSDPYVKFELKKDKLVFDRSFGKMESSKKHGDCNPVYNETFTFNSVDSLNKMDLNITVMDDDIGMDDKIGEAHIDLDHALLNATPKDMILVVDKKRFKVFAKEATIHLKLSYEE